MKVSTHSPYLLPHQLARLCPFPETHLLLFFLEMHSLVTAAGTMTTMGTSNGNRMEAKLDASVQGTEIGVWDKKRWGGGHSLPALSCHPGGTAFPAHPWVLALPPGSCHSQGFQDLDVALLLSGDTQLPQTLQEDVHPAGPPESRVPAGQCFSKSSPGITSISHLGACEKIQASWGPTETYQIHISGAESQRQPCPSLILGTRIQSENCWCRGTWEL